MRSSVQIWGEVRRTDGCRSELNRSRRIEAVPPPLPAALSAERSALCFFFFFFFRHPATGVPNVSDATSCPCQIRRRCRVTRDTRSDVSIPPRRREGKLLPRESAKLKIARYRSYSAIKLVLATFFGARGARRPLFVPFRLLFFFFPAGLEQPTLEGRAARGKSADSCPRSFSPMCVKGARGTSLLSNSPSHEGKRIPCESTLRQLRVGLTLNDRCVILTYNSNIIPLKLHTKKFKLYY